MLLLFKYDRQILLYLWAPDCNIIVVLITKLKDKKQQTGNKYKTTVHKHKSRLTYFDYHCKIFQKLIKQVVIQYNMLG